MRRILLTALVALATLGGLIAAATPAAASQWSYVWIESTTAPLCVDASTYVPTTQTCVDIGAQLWTFDGATTGSHHRVIDNGSGQCLQALSATSVAMQACSSVTAQKWRLVGSGFTFSIKSVSNGACLQRAGLTPGQQVRLGTCSSANWKLLY